jgi:hypothetical protein
MQLSTPLGSGPEFRHLPWVCGASKEHRRLQPTSILLNPHSGVLQFPSDDTFALASRCR